MKLITLLCVGKLKTPWAQQGCNEYITRLPWVQVLEVQASRETDPHKQRNEEGERLLAQLEKLKGETWILDEKGKTKTSQEFADFLGKSFDSGIPLTLVIGGAYGLSDDIRKAARGALRLSDMTFPHELCRVVALEQLYRAGEIRRGSGYHHE